MAELSFITFPSIHHLLQFEGVLKENGLKFQIIPLPAEIRSDCGTCLLVEANNLGIILKLAAEHNVPVEGAFPITNQKKLNFYHKLFSVV